MTKINIALGMTPNWMPYAQVTVASILDNASANDEYRFFIMSSEFSAESKANFLKLKTIKNCDFDFIVMNEKDFEGAIHDWLGISSSYRLKLASITNEKKVLYLDTDIITVKDIAELYNIDVSDYYLGAIEDKMGYYMKKRVNLEDDKKFINGGVQLLNLEKFREDSIEEKIFSRLRENHIYTDQDVVNDICRDKILYLPLKYNFMPSATYSQRKGEAQSCLEDPFVLHYSVKPWRNNQITCAEYWNKYKQMVDNL